MNIDRLSGFNPLRGLDLYGLVNYLEMGERGYYADLMWLYRLVLRRNGSARAVRRKLIAAIGKLDWNIKIPDKLEGARKATAGKQQAELRRAVDLLRNFRATLRHLAFADIMGFAHCNKVYAGEGASDPWEVTELRVVPQWFLCRDGLFKPWAYNAEAANTNRGQPIDPRHWVIREIDDPAAEIFTFAHLKMTGTDADWDQFNDTYAVPPIFVIQPPNVPREREADYQRTAEEIVSDGRGSLPYQSDIKSVSGGAGAVETFTERLRYYREEIVIAGTGGILTTLDGNTGIGKGPADNHDDGWIDIAHEICMGVSEVLQDQFCAPLLQRKFPGEEILAYFELDKPEHGRDPGSVLTDAKTAREAGYAIAPEELSEKSGYTLTEAAAPAAGNPLTAPKVEASPSSGAAAPPVAPQPPAGPVNSPSAESPKASAAGEAKPSLVQAALADDLELESRWLAPVADVLARIEAMIADPAVPLESIQAEIEKAVKAMPELLGQLNVGELAQALEKATGPAAVEGLADGLRAKTGKPAKNGGL